MGVIAVPQADFSPGYMADHSRGHVYETLQVGLEGAWYPGFGGSFQRIHDMSGTGHTMILGSAVAFYPTDYGTSVWFAQNTKYGTTQYDVSRWTGCTIATFYRRTGQGWTFQADLGHSADKGIHLYKPNNEPRYEYIVQDTINPAVNAQINRTGSLLDWEFICITHDAVSELVTGYLYGQDRVLRTAQTGGAIFDYAGASGLFSLSTRSASTPSERGEYIGMVLYSRALVPSVGRSVEHRAPQA